MTRPHCLPPGGWQNGLSQHPLSRDVMSRNVLSRNLSSRQTVLRKGLLLLCAALLTTPASAEGVNPVHFSGFGTLGVAFGGDREADYISYYEQSEGVGRTQSKDYGLDTVFGVQADARPLESLSLTAQMQSRRLADHTSTPYFEWAFAKYQATDDLELRLGRVVTPMFMVSEARTIGYAQTTARLPGEVYLLNPITYVDGGGLTQRFALGETLFAANITAGKLEQELPTIYGDLDIDYDTTLFNISAEHGFSMLRFGHARSTLDFNNDVLDLLEASLNDLAAANIEGASQIRDMAAFHDFDVDFYDLGYQFDNGEWQLLAEIVVRRADSYIVTDNDAFYVQGAKRLGRWTPYARYSNINSINDMTKVPTLDVNTIENEADRFKAGIVNLYGANLKILDERTSYTVGTRWDVADNYAIKAQLDHINKPPGSATLFYNFTEKFRDSRQRFNIYTLTLDFIF